MRKQTKIAAVVSAAALLALGASITSFAAAKGTWMMVDGEWYCYDKNGDAYENTFCANNGKEYYVGDDGRLVRSDWVEYDGEYYFVNSSGAKIINDWRQTTPYDDEDAEQEWYYFQSTGKMATNKKIVYKGKTFYFDADGKMLTGWVTADGTQVVNEENGVDKDHTFFCDETGARIEKEWVLSTEPSTDDDDADADEYYYYMKSSGKVATGKQNNIKGQTYLFDSEGRMLSGWVAYDATNKTYGEIDGETDTFVLGEDVNTVYYCGDSDDGHVKKNKWMKLWRPADTYDEDEDVDKWWYWIEKDGKVFIPSSTNAAAQGRRYTFGDGSLDAKSSYYITKKKINSKDYFFNENGEMLTRFIEVTKSNADLADLNPGMYYFGGADDGSMKTGSQTIKDDNSDAYKFYFGTKTVDKTGERKGVGITGNKSNKLYYKGLLITAKDYRYQTATVNGHTFIVNQNGAIQHSQVEYKEDGDVLIDAKTDGDYKITFSTVDNQWKYSVVNADALKDNVESINVTEVMSTID